MARIATILFSVIFYSFAFAQQFPYDRNYFQWPVRITPGIVANFGELRPDHWHMGLDIRTNQKENIPVYAAAGGYISRIVVQPFGFGKAIYINHPNGLTTVYGHLNKFFSALDSFVRHSQYANESWETDLQFKKNEFPVRKGQFIAYSGSTGSSQGPHVHFEIRNTKTDQVINPQFFNLPLADKTAPVFTRLAVYDRKFSTYMQTPVLLNVKRTDSGYILPNDTIFRTGFSKLSFAIGAYDQVTSSGSPNGIYSAKIFFDDEPSIGFVLDSMDYIQTEYMNAQIDYLFQYNTHIYLQHLSQLPGDHGPVYRKTNGDGILLLTDTAVHSISIKITDINKNSSSLSFQIQHNDSLPDAEDFHSNETLIPEKENSFRNGSFEIVFPPTSFYDTVSFFPGESPGNALAPNAASAPFGFGYRGLPVHGRFELRLRSENRIDSLLNRIVVRNWDSRGSIAVKKGKWQDGWISARFSDLGGFQAFYDTVAPTINELGKEDTVDLSPAQQIVFYPKDNSGIKAFRAELNGSWLMFDNDKGSSWTYIFDKNFPYGVYNLKVIVEDIVGNKTVKEWWFKRNPYKPTKKKKLPTKKASRTKKVIKGRKSK